MTTKIRTTVLVCITFLSIGQIAPTGEALATPVIKDFSSTGGRTTNKTGPTDRMYLVKPGDRITFSVQAEGAEKYVWQVNKKVVENAAGNSFTWTVPGEKGIWEIHVKVSNVSGEAHEEWVLSTLGKAEAPDFFEYFSDRKYAKRTETDPWDRPLPEWLASGGGLFPPDVSRGYIQSLSYPRMSRLRTLYKKEAYGTWKFRYRYTGPPVGGRNHLSYYFIVTPDGFSYKYMRAYDTHHYFAELYMGEAGWSKMDCDSGFVPIPGKWYDVLLIRTRDGWFYTYINGFLEYRWYVTDGSRCKEIWFQTHQVQEGKTAAADNFEIYENKFFFPRKEIRYGKYVSNYSHSQGTRCKWRKVFKDGIVAKGRGITLSDIAEAVAKPSLFRYDRKTKTAECYTNLFVEEGSELVIKGETLKFCKDKCEFGAGFGATLRITNSTITSDRGCHIWNLTSPSTHFGWPISFNEKLQTWPGTLNAAAFAPNFESFQSIFIDNSVIDNAAHLFFAAPFELRITDTRITNLMAYDPEDETPRYREGAGLGSMQKVWTDYVRGPKALWVMYKYADIVDFELNNVTITGAKGEPLDIVFMIQTEWTNWIPRYLPNIRKLNLLNMDMEKVNVVVKKGLGMGSFGYNAHRPEPSPGQWYQSNLGLVNCKFKDTTVPTDRARVCVKYYLDVKVVDEKGNPIPDATVTVVNEVDNENHPAENIAVRRYRHVPVETCKPIDGGTWKAGANFFYFDMYSPLSSTRTGKDGHTPLPEDKTKTLVLKDYQHTQEGRKQFTYKITVQAGGKKKTITGVNPGPHWYRPDPNKPTYTITAVLDGKTVTESTLKKQGLAGLSTSKERR